MGYLIAVDNGHGMATAGKRTPAIPEDWFGKKKGESIHEKEFNKPTAEFLIIALERCGFKTLNVSPGTDDVPLKDRYTKANNAKADAFISKHYNACTGKWGKPSGIETIVSQYSGDDSKKLASCVHKELLNAHKRIDRGVKTDIVQSGINIAVLHNSKMPAILTESGFMDNLVEAKTMLDPVFQKADAEATCKGVCAFFGVKYVPESNKPTKPINRKSNKDDIVWLQNKLIKANLGYKITASGTFDTKTRIAVLIYWESKGWKQDGTDDGWEVESGTINELNKLG